MLRVFKENRLRMNRTLRPHIFENSDGKFTVVYGETILGVYPTIRAAIRRAGDNFIYTANTRP